MPNEPQIPKWICNESHSRTENEPPQKDLVIEARELLAINLPDSVHSIEHALWADAIERQHESPFWGSSKKIAEAYARAPELLRQLADEVERLRELVRHMQFPQGG